MSMPNETEETRALRQAIDDLYLAFAQYPLPRWTGSCLHCHDEAEELRLHAKPLRDLTTEDLESYVWSALLTWGSVDTFKHLLPRILELAADYGWTVDREIVLSRLRRGDWRTWPVEEQVSVSAYLMAVWTAALSDESFVIPADEWLCVVGQAVDDLGPFLEAWYMNPHASSRYQLAEFIFENSNKIETRGRLAGGFWSDRREQMAQVIDWLLRPSVSEILEQAFFEHSSEPESENLSWAVDQLAGLRAGYGGDRE